MARIRRKEILGPKSRLRNLKMKIRLIQVHDEDVYRDDEYYSKVLAGIGEHTDWTEIDNNDYWQLTQAIHLANINLKKTKNDWRYLLIREIPEQPQTIKLLLDDWIKHQAEEKKRRERENELYELKQKKTKEEREKKRLEKLMSKYNLKKAE